MLGSDLNTFYRHVFEDALVCGLTYVYVDYPNSVEDITLQEEKDRNLRPYAVHIKAEQLIKAVSETVDGRVRLRQGTYTRGSRNR